MAIIGIGTDIVEIERIQRVLGKYPERLPNRVLADSELEIFKSHAHPHRYLAKRFAAKEAAAKALGTGMRRGIGFSDFEVLNGKDGRPEMRLLGEAAEEMNRLGVTHIHLSLSDERTIAQAFVVLEK